MAATVGSSEDLMRLGERLVREHAMLPAGAVLRTLARAVRRARAAGCPPELVTRTAELIARRQLLLRAQTPASPPAQSSSPPPQVSE